MKKTKIQICIVATIFMFFGAGLVSCSGVKDENGKYINKKYNAEKMVNIIGQKTELTDAKYIINEEQNGFSFILPENIRERYDNGLFEVVPDQGYVFLVYYSAQAMDMIKSFNFQTCTEDEYYSFLTDVSKRIFSFGAIYRLPLNNPQGLDSEFTQYIDSTFAQKSEIARLTSDKTEFIYYFAWNDDISSSVFTDEEKTEVQMLIDGSSEFVNSIMVYPPQIAESAITSDKESAPNYGSINGDLTGLNSSDLEGNPVTSDIFAAYDVTMVNIWATWCGPCLSEIPELAKLPAMLPDNAQLISICTDGDSATEDAKKILETSNATYLTIIPNQALNEMLLKSVTAVPTTIFVDSAGNLIGEPVVGVPGKDAANAYFEKIQSLLAK